MTSGKQPHILTTASNLLGICFILITGMKLSHVDLNTYADEICIFSSLFFTGSCIMSYISLLSEKEKISIKAEGIADFLFMIGIFSLFIAVVIFSYGSF